METKTCTETQLYDLIPESTRSKYGNTKQEIVNKFANDNNYIIITNELSSAINAVDSLTESILYTLLKNKSQKDIPIHVRRIFDSINLDHSKIIETRDKQECDLYGSNYLFESILRAYQEYTKVTFGIDNIMFKNMKSIEDDFDKAYKCMITDKLFTK